jgi:hypothetical protein
MTLLISELDFEFTSEFLFWLGAARGCNHNSAIKYMSNLKKIALICVNTKWLKRTPFPRVQTDEEGSRQKSAGQKGAQTPDRKSF